MDKSFTYKGFTAAIAFSTDDDIFVGRVTGIDSTISFEGKSIEEVEREFRHAIDHYLKDIGDER